MNGKGFRNQEDRGKEERERRQKGFQDPKRAGKGKEREERKGFRNQGDREK